MNDMTITQAVDAPRVASTAVPIAIPLARLVASAANVRKTGAKEGIAELAASIAAHGLRQNLNVKPTESERFEVVAGGRRLRALRLLVKEKKLPKDVAVPCIVIDAAEDASEISLVENTLRTAMHPDDQFAAFQGLVDGGMPVEDVAARFGVTPALVERRLKLAKVSPRLRGLFRKGELTLDHMMAFTVGDDHIAQERVWKELPQWSRDPEDIRAALTGEALRFDHPLARFVGVEAYVAAGGGVMRDLFDEANEGYLSDRVLLLRLAGDKLDAAVAEVKAEGWKWVKAELERDYGTHYRRVFPVGPEDDEDKDVPAAYSADDMARAGAIIRVNRDGGLEVDRGLVHPDDVQREPAEGGEAGVPAKRKAEPGDLPAVLVEDLTAHRTAALRIELARNPAVALAATVHALALSLIYGESVVPPTCLAVKASSENLERHVEVLEDSSAHAALALEAERWGDRLPGDVTDLFGWCLAQPQDVLLDLLAYLAGLTVNAVEVKYDGNRNGRVGHADALAEALSLDMAQHWTPSVEGFYGRVTKPTLIHIVSEAKAPMQVSISAVKRKDAARYVAQAMEGRTWLPLPLRTGGALPAQA